MKTDVVKVSKTGMGMDDALSIAVSAAQYRGLDNKEALHIRLLAEEMMGMVYQIAGDTELEFWVESEDKEFELHLVAYPKVTEKVRDELLKASTSGHNEAAKGFMGKVRDIFNAALADKDMDDMSDYYAQGLILPNDMYMSDPMAYTTMTSVATWSLSNYKESMDKDGSDEGWDELERSIVANIADEVKIYIDKKKVEMIVYKKFDK